MLGALIDDGLWVVAVGGFAERAEQDVFKAHGHILLVFIRSK
jgi:hypothetical protein